MFWWPYRAACDARLVDQVYVATADEEIINSCRRLGVQFIRTSHQPQTGTDRVAEASIQLVHATHIINLQADEPTITSDVLDTLVERLVSTDHPMVTLATQGRSGEDFLDPNCVKVRVDNRGMATAFLRVPTRLDRWDNYLVHVGVYGFSMESLSAFVRLPESQAERTERLEQLRALAAGWEIDVVKTDWSGLGVDTPQDLHRILELMSQDDSGAAGH
jgi:3-deoxy-manno-octulosonate cytidylyltransferase (CMP-KDO synthetase)